MTTTQSEFRARWGEMEARDAGDWASRMVQDEVLMYMSQLRPYFSEGAVLTLTVRHPDHPDGSRDTIVTNDPTVIPPE